MPGVTITNAWPHVARISGISSGDATTPSSPAAWVSAASRSTWADIGPDTPISPSIPSLKLVSIVTAMMSGEGREARAASSLAATRAARIIAAPPAA